MFTRLRRRSSSQCGVRVSGVSRAGFIFSFDETLCNALDTEKQRPTEGVDPGRRPQARRPAPGRGFAKAIRTVSPAFRGHFKGILAVNHALNPDGVRGVIGAKANNGRRAGPVNTRHAQHPKEGEQDPFHVCLITSYKQEVTIQWMIGTSANVQFLASHIRKKIRLLSHQQRTGLLRAQQLLSRLPPVVDSMRINEAGSVFVNKDGYIQPKRSRTGTSSRDSLPTTGSLGGRTKSSVSTDSSTGTLDALADFLNPKDPELLSVKKVCVPVATQPLGHRLVIRVHCG